VYDAGSRSVDVYLDGRLDNGCANGTVTPRQNLSGMNTYVGRSGQRRAAFAGLVDDVRIYSRALTQREIGEQIEQATRKARVSLYEPSADVGESAAGYDASRPCAPRRTIGAQVAELVVALGILVTVLCAWVWPWRGFRGIALAISLAAGVVLIVPMTEFVLTPFRWYLPLLTLAGGASVVVSTREGRR